MARIKDRYNDEIRTALVRKFGYTSPMQAPRLQKVTLNMGVGEAKQDSKMLDAAQQQLATSRARSRTSAAPASPSRRSSCARACRSGSPSRCATSARTSSSTASSRSPFPRLRDFRGLNPRSFDGRGNYSMGIREQIIFPEIDYDNIDQVRGLDVTITTSAQTDAEAFALLSALGMPFARDGRPAGFETLESEPRGRVNQEI